MIEAILWDNDGILVDTERLFFESTRRILATIGIQLTSERFLELSMRQGRSAFDLATESGWQREQVTNLKRQRDLVYSKMLRKETRILPGVAETLKTLHGHTRMAVVTSSQRQHFDVMHANLGLVRYFEFVLAREDYGKTKPDPESYLLALERLGIKAPNCVAVEDSERGLMGDNHTSRATTIRIPDQRQ